MMNAEPETKMPGPMEMEKVEEKKEVAAVINEKIEIKPKEIVGDGKTPSICDKYQNIFILDLPLELVEKILLHLSAYNVFGFKNASKLARDIGTRALDSHNVR